MRKYLFSTLAAVMLAATFSIVAPAAVAGDCSVANCREQGGARWHIGDGGSFDVLLNGEIDIEAGGALKIAGTTVTASATELNLIDGYTGTTADLNLIDGVTATTAELNVTDNMPADITFAAASAGTNIAEVTITVKDAAAATIASVFNLDVWLSDAATCAGLTSTSASGTVTVKSASGAIIGTYTAKKALRVQTLATGIFILEITDTAKTTFYPCAALPSTGATKIGTQLATGDYG